jgi:hypothetical protein
MSVNTKKVEGRRNVRYASLDELLADAQRFATGNAKTLGNWSPGQIYEHLARSLDSSIDGFDMSFPAPLRWMMSLFMKKKFLTKELPPGFKSPDKYVPDETPVEEGLAALTKAIGRQKQESHRVPHPGFGKLSLDEWNDFHLRHAEMHMSFLADN